MTDAEFWPGRFSNNPLKKFGRGNGERSSIKVSEDKANARERFHLTTVLAYEETDGMPCGRPCCGRSPLDGRAAPTCPTSPAAQHRSRSDHGKNGPRKIVDIAVEWPGKGVYFILRTAF
jgi:hypothetical protein